ncbi:MAG: LptE family protein [Candidatus Eisenbacteria bacterium]|nr:LptE family protein [Candidatus Eisenbacteria bacterium]
MKLRSSLILFAFLGISGCGYTVSTLLPAHIKTVAVPVFKNETLEYGLEQELTEILTRSIIQDNHLRVTDESRANSVVLGTIIGYENRVFGYNAREQVEEYQVAITVKVEFKDLVKNKQIWSDDLVGLTTYDVAGSQATTEQLGRRRALESIAIDVITRTVEGW